MSTRFLFAFFALTAVTGPEHGPEVKPLDEHYVAVRRDVFVQLNAGHGEDKLKACTQEREATRAALRDAEVELVAARAQLADLRAALAVIATEQERAPAPEAPRSVQGEVDGVVGLGAGFVLGATQCVALAWILNQPGLTR